MAGRSWTELFFLDEAVALSAGHRPCFLCRREAAELFRAAWAAAKGTPPPAAAAIDVVLHRERLKDGRKRIHLIPAPVLALPDGAVVVVAGSAFTLNSGLGHRWTNEGYEPPIPLRRANGLLTLPSTLDGAWRGVSPGAPSIDHCILSRSRCGPLRVALTECHALFGQFLLRVLVFGQVRQTHAAEDVRCFGELDIVIADDLDAVAPWIAEV